MAQQLIRSLTEVERYVVLELVIEYVSDIRTLMSLSVVSKQTRSAVYRSNGLRDITFNGFFVNGVNINWEHNEKLKERLRWIWTTGRPLKTVCLSADLKHMGLCGKVTELLNSMAITDKRRIETIHISGDMPPELLFDLVKESRTTLRRLHVELRDQFHVDLWFHSLKIQHGFYFCSLYERSDSENFWFVVQHCERLQFLDLKLRYVKSLPVNLVHVLHHTPLKHLGLTASWDEALNSEILQEVVDVLSGKNLRNNLESLELDYRIISFLLPLVAELACSHTPVVFASVTKLTFDLLVICCQETINWLAFWTVFPAVNEIKDPLSAIPLLYAQRDSAWSKNLSTFSKTYLELSASRACDVVIKIPVPHSCSTNKLEQISAVAKAVTLPEDQDWCVSQGVHIETETHDERVERVTLRKDTSTLVFDLKLLKD